MTSLRTFVLPMRGDILTPLGVGLLVLLMVMAITSSSASFQDVLIQTMLWAGLAGAWNIIGGYAYQFSLGHSVFIGLGAYTSTRLFIAGVSPWIGLAIGASFAAAVSIVIGVIILRTRGHHFALATLAMAFIFFIIVTSAESVTGGGVGLSAPLDFGIANLSFREKTPYVFIVFAYALLVLLVSAAIRRSRLGYSLLAYREDPTAASALGIRTTAAKVTGLAFSATLTAIGGSLLAQYILFINPQSVAGPFLSVEIAMYAIVGGLGVAAGPVFGAVLVFPLTDYLRATLGTTFAGAPGLAFGVLLIAVLFLAPRGISGLIEQGIQSVGRRWRS